MSTDNVPHAWAWRLTTLIVGVGAGALMIVTGLNSHGMDLRAASITDLATVVEQQKTHTDALQAQVADLNGQVTALGKQVSDTDVKRLQRRVDLLKDPAGLDPVEGPGITVTLDDAPKADIDEALKTGTPPPDELLVHQQDIQAVVNALWLGGAEAMTVKGQRIVSTTGIKCVGNTVILHGVPYSPPYDIKAIGDPTLLQRSLDDSAYVSAYRTLEFHLFYSAVPEPVLQLPGYTGSLTLSYAKPGPTQPPAAGGATR